MKNLTEYIVIIFKSESFLKFISKSGVTFPLWPRKSNKDIFLFYNLMLKVIVQSSCVYYQENDKDSHIIYFK